ncbi:MAG: sulfite exporter TauE/SafE family protein [Lentisphaerae bacterium]|nr:sulfite exporter TauE/SafE family protein [Lentisphaerota bacterium]MCP4101427.1 sulfite exporter TauE/SafE family protein [Lentisphaerota bacterium]
MADFILVIASAFWLGILTSISPCPLATNIAAVSFVGRRMGNAGKVLFAGLLYTAGRTLTYLVLGVLLVESLLSAPVLSHLLQKYMNLLLGPVLILVGMVLLEMLKLNFKNNTANEKIQGIVEKSGVLGALLLGILFALSFCPVSAALFFGSLLPMAVENNSGILLPVLYGVATGIPVMVFAFFIAFGANRLAAAYDKVTSFEKWARRITGVLFILIGIYYCLTRIFGLDF